MIRRLIPLSATLLAAQAHAQFINGNFETGSLNPWTFTLLPGGNNLVTAIATYDIDGAGPLPASFGAQLGVGSTGSNQAGLDMTQSLSLTPGQAYSLSVDWATDFSSASGGSNVDGATYSIVADGAPIASHSVGPIPGGAIIRGQLSASYTASTSGPHTLGIRITRGFTPNSPLREHLDNVSISPAPPACYANDFQCFLNAFAAGCS